MIHLDSNNSEIQKIIDKVIVESEKKMDFYVKKL